MKEFHNFFISFMVKEYWVAIVYKNLRLQLICFQRMGKKISKNLLEQKGNNIKRTLLKNIKFYCLSLLKT